MEIDFEVLGDVKDIEPIAVNLSIRERKSLTSRFGGRRWRKLKGVALVWFPNDDVRRAEVHWYEAHGVGRHKMKSNVFWIETMVTNKNRVEFAICMSNEGYEDLEEAKIYRVLPDAKATEVGCIRVVDESGKDYLYPQNRFAIVDLPEYVRARLPRPRPSRRADKALPATVKSRRRVSRSAWGRRRSLGP
jgi:hypothetical protein